MAFFDSRDPWLRSHALDDWVLDQSTRQDVPPEELSDIGAAALLDTNSSAQAAPLESAADSSAS